MTKARRVMEEWRTPPPLLSYDVPIGAFRIDNDIRKLSDKGWLGTWKLEDAVRFARRGLEIAIVQAQTEHEQNPSQIIPEWDKMAEHATSADKALGRLMHDLVVGGKPKVPGELIRSLRALTESYRERRAQGQSAADAIPERIAQAKSQADALFQVWQLMPKLASAARKRERELSTARKGQWEGDAPFRAFALILGETWVYLTHRRPSRNTDHHLNPFLRFLRNAWFDAGGKVVGEGADLSTVFVSGARVAHSAFPPDQVKLIAHSGSYRAGRDPRNKLTP